jgi:nucleoside-diphosphate-sugar epimerase
MKGLRQPVHAADVAQACLAAMQNEGAQCQSFNLSGGDVMSYQEMVARIFLAMGKTPRFIPIPLALCAVAFSVLRLLTRNKYLTMAIVERMNQDLVFEHSEAAEKLNFVPRNFRLDQADFPR